MFRRQCGFLFFHTAIGLYRVSILICSQPLLAAADAARSNNDNIAQNGLKSTEMGGNPRGCGARMGWISEWLTPEPHAIWPARPDRRQGRGCARNCSPGVDRHARRRHQSAQRPMALASLACRTAVIRFGWERARLILTAPQGPHPRTVTAGGGQGRERALSDQARAHHRARRVPSVPPATHL